MNPGPRRPLLVPILLGTTVLLGACSTGGDDTAATTVTSATSATTATTAAAATTDPAAATRARFARVGPTDPGCTIAVARDGEIVFAEAYGAARLDPLTPMTTGTVVDIGSTSKQFTATALLLLAEEGRLSLDDRLATHVPTLPAWAAGPTLRQLMHHQSGIPDYIALLEAAGIATTDPASDADSLAVLGRVTALDFEPGTQWAYSNSNYFLMARVVLAVTGRDLGEYLAATVFEPLGLAMVMDPTARIPTKAVSYEGVGTARTVADSPWEQLGDGAVQTTPTELVRWATQYWAPTLGSPALAAARLDGAADTGVGGRYGAGIAEADVPGLGRVLTHSGGWGGFVTSFSVLPDRRLALAATCTSPDTAEKLGLGSDLELLEPWVTG